MSAVEPVLDEDLRTALHVFRHFFEISEQPISILNEKGEHVVYNAANAELDGCQRDVVLGRNVLEAFPSIHEAENEMIQALKTGREFLTHHKTYFNTRGRLVDYEHTTLPLHARDGRIIGVIESGRDLSSFRKLQHQVNTLSARLYKSAPRKKMLTASAAMKALVKQAERLAASDFPVLIIGETGTGKELIANLIHEHSARSNRPFVALNCGALPATLIETTLFGAVKGAYTGAENSSGNIELADGGTLFLDELNSLPIESQAKLLRFLQEKSYYKVGGTQERHANVRVVAAMNESPQELMDSHRLRPDLFYRLEIGMLNLPPLRERREEILPLAELFCKRFCEENQIPPIGIAPSAQRELLEYDWPGNIRMLENVILRSLLLHEPGNMLTRLVFNDPVADASKSVAASETASSPYPRSDDPPLRLKSVAPMSSASSTNLPLEVMVAEFERGIIVRALTACQGCVAATARQLNISRGALQYKIRKYGIMLNTCAS